MCKEVEAFLLQQNANMLWDAEPGPESLAEWNYRNFKTWQVLSIYLHTRTCTGQSWVRPFTVEMHDHLQCVRLHLSWNLQSAQGHTKYTPAKISIRSSSVFLCSKDSNTTRLIASRMESKTNLLQISGFHPYTSIQFQHTHFKQYLKNLIRLRPEIRAEET